MPTVSVSTSSGKVKFNYVISTPKSASAKSIDKNLPTILFLHPVYIAQAIFHTQFNDPNLRRFNLVAFDMRSHGSTIGDVPKNFGPIDAANDIAKFIDALKIPACHFFGLSLGTIIAMHFAMAYPTRCLSCFMLSPLSMREPADVFEGRQEIHDYWIQGFEGSPEDQKLASQDAVYGSIQLAFSNELNPLAQALVSLTVPQAIKNWDPNHFSDYHTITIRMFEADRERYSREWFSKIRCPVKLIFCSKDIAYTYDQAEGVLNTLVDAGVKASLDQVPACHFGNVMEPEEVNELFTQFLEIVEPSTSKLKVPENAKSPYESDLLKAGWEPEDSDSDY